MIITAGSLLIQQEREQEEALSIPKSEKTEAVLSALRQKAVRLFRDYLKYEYDKKSLILDSADTLADILKAEGKDEFISKICYTICKVIKPIKGFASDRYIRKVLPAEYKDIEHRQSALSRGTSSATSSKVASQQKYEEHQKLIRDKTALQYAEKGITDYTIDDLDQIEEAAILREIAKHHMQKAIYLEVELNALTATREPLTTPERRKRGRPKKSNGIIPSPPSP